MELANRFVELGVSVDLVLVRAEGYVDHSESGVRICWTCTALNSRISLMPIRQESAGKSTNVVATTGGIISGYYLCGRPGIPLTSRA